MDNKKKKINVGMLIPKVKKGKLKLPERIQELCDKEGIEITEIDIEKDLENEGPFDIFFHKILDFYNDRLGDENALQRIDKAKRFAQKFKDMVIIDDFESCEKLLDRKYQVDMLKNCSMTVDGIKVFTPRFLEITVGTSLEQIYEIVTKENIQFPILAKPMSSSLAEGSHDMTMIFNIENMKDLPVPCLIQEFCNHGGILYKVFVIGDRYNICQRPSIKDVDITLKKTLKFDTRNVSKTGKAFLPDFHESDPNLRKWLSCDDEPNLLNRNVIDILYKKLSEMTKLKLYGLDILIENTTGNYALIDLNQFPGYTGINQKHFIENIVHMFKTSSK